MLLKLQTADKSDSGEGATENEGGYLMMEIASYKAL